MRMQYTPSDWYWRIADSTTHVYSSARASSVPVDDATYVGWLAGGGRPTRIASEAALSKVLASVGLEPIVPVVPKEVEMAQARLELLAVGALAAVEAAIASLPSPAKEAALIEWEFRAKVRRDSQLVQELSAALEWSSEYVDARFISAAKR